MDDSELRGTFTNLDEHEHEHEIELSSMFERSTLERSNNNFTILFNFELWKFLF
jgi:hypothetical protein